MLSWAITFLVIALIAAILGFGGIAGTAIGMAKIIFFVFLVLFVVSFAMGRRAPRVGPSLRFAGSVSVWKNRRHASRSSGRLCDRNGAKSRVRETARGRRRAQS